jgi:hypothetical protein
MRPEDEERLRELKALGPGWNGYQAPSLSEKALEGAAAFLERIGTDALRFRIYPMPEGGVQLEVDAACEGCFPKDAGMDFEFHPDGRVVAWLYGEAFAEVDGQEVQGAG